MKSAAPALLFAVAVSGSALAADCTADLIKIDAALTRESIAADVKSQARNMRAQVADLCKAGNEQEAADVIAETKSMLAIE